MFNPASALSADSQLPPHCPTELLIDGDHTLAQFAEASTRVISRCVAHLWQKVGGWAVARRQPGGGRTRPSCSSHGNWAERHTFALRAHRCMRRESSTLRARYPLSPHSRPSPAPTSKQNVVLEATLLKPQMCIPGADYTGEKPTSVRSRVPLLCTPAAPCVPMRGVAAGFAA